MILLFKFFVVLFIIYTLCNNNDKSVLSFLFTQPSIIIPSRIAIISRRRKTIITTTIQQQQQQRQRQQGNNAVCTLFQQQQQQEQSVDEFNNNIYWQSYISIDSNAMNAISELLDHIKSSSTPDLVFLFVAQYHADKFEDIIQEAYQRLPKHTRLLSVIGGGVIGDDTEMDESTKPGMSILFGTLPNGTNDFNIFDFNELHNPPPSSSDNNEYWDKYKDTSIIIFADPWSPLEQFTAAINNKKSVIAGGISVPTGTGSTVAIDNDPKPQGSMVGVAFHNDNIQLQVVVAQGCRPVGPIYTVTAVEGSCILELDSKPAISVLEDFFQTIHNATELQAISAGLVCGILAGTEENNEWLSRQILGFVPSKHGIVIAGGATIGDKLQFHVRDKDAAKHDLHLMVQRVQTERLYHINDYDDSVENNNNYRNRPIIAAFQFSCVARGRMLFGEPNIDIKQTKRLLNNNNNNNNIAAIGGFYANGEIGPVGIAGFSNSNYGGTTSSYVHGFTTVMAFLCCNTASKTKSSSFVSAEETIVVKNDESYKQISGDNNNNNNNNNSDDGQPGAWG